MTNRFLRRDEKPIEQWKTRRTGFLPWTFFGRGSNLSSSVKILSDLTSSIYCLSIHRQHRSLLWHSILILIIRFSWNCKNMKSYWSIETMEVYENTSKMPIWSQSIISANNPQTYPILCLMIRTALICFLFSSLVGGDLRWWDTGIVDFQRHRWTHQSNRF